MTRTSASAATLTGSSAKHPGGSGGSGSPSGSPESTKPSQVCWTPSISTARAISSRRTWARSRAMCGSPLSFSLRMSPRSPPVQETTITCTPSATYFAIVAAPLLDSSSGWAWTAMSRSSWDTLALLVIWRDGQWVPHHSATQSPILSLPQLRTEHTREHDVFPADEQPQVVGHRKRRGGGDGSSSGLVRRLRDSRQGALVQRRLRGRLGRAGGDPLRPAPGDRK